MLFHIKLQSKSRRLGVNLVFPQPQQEQEEPPVQNNDNNIFLRHVQISLEFC